jgi:hypothetical protein
MDYITLFALGAGSLGILYSLVTASWIVKQPSGSDACVRFPTLSTKAQPRFSAVNIKRSQLSEPFLQFFFTF